MKYAPAQIAWEIEQTALGNAYFGNALRVAKDFPFLSDEDRACLDRRATGIQRSTDHILLQDIANRIMREAIKDLRRSE